jgi:hypothetical protein
MDHVGEVEGKVKAVASQEGRAGWAAEEGAEAVAKEVTGEGGPQPEKEKGRAAS